MNSVKVYFQDKPNDIYLEFYSPVNLGEIYLSTYIDDHRAWTQQLDSKHVTSEKDMKKFDVL